MDIRQTLRYLGAPIGAKSFLFGDNRSVVTSAILPHSTLTKRHNIFAFHRVREAIAAILMAFYWIQSAYNSSDMLSKHWDHPTVYPMTLKLLITRGNITLRPKETTQEKERGHYNRSCHIITCNMHETWGLIYLYTMRTLPTSCHVLPHVH